MALYISRDNIPQDGVERVTAAPVPAGELPVAREQPSSGLFAEVLRDIARGGLAGLLTGLLIAGIGGRIVMRLAALSVPEAAGQFTENGNRIGDITTSGSVGLILTGGLFFGLLGATIWVVVSPWIPTAGWRRTIVAMPIAVALTGGAVVQGRNSDFRTLEHDVATVVLLLMLVAVAGASISFFDGWLDRRLPRPGTRPIADGIYLLLAISGGGLIFPIVLASYLGEETVLGLAIAGVGIATLAFWRLRYRGESPRRRLNLAGRGSLLIAVGFGFLAIAPDVGTALGWR